MIRQSDRQTDIWMKNRHTTGQTDRKERQIYGCADRQAVIRTHKQMNGQID